MYIIYDRRVDQNLCKIVLHLPLTDIIQELFDTPHDLLQWNIGKLIYSYWLYAQLYDVKSWFDTPHRPVYKPRSKWILTAGKALA